VDAGIVKKMQKG